MSVKHFKTASQREKWQSKRDKKFWINGTYQKYNPKDRLWVLLTLSKDIAMVDKEKFIDEDGDELYRVVFQVNKDGTPTTDHGFLRCFKNNYVKSQYVEPVSEAYQKKLDDWVRSMKECVEKKDPKIGFIYDTLEYTPLRLRIPGWERMSKKDLQKCREQNIKNMMGLFRSQGLF